MCIITTRVVLPLTERVCRGLQQRVVGVADQHVTHCAKELACLQRGRRHGTSDQGLHGRHGSQLGRLVLAQGGRDDVLSRKSLGARDMSDAGSCQVAGVNFSRMANSPSCTDIVELLFKQRKALQRQLLEGHLDVLSERLARTGRHK